MTSPPAGVVDHLIRLSRVSVFSTHRSCPSCSIGRQVRVELAELGAGVGGGERPCDLGLGGVALVAPAGDLLVAGVVVGDAAGEAWAAERAPLALGHVE